MKIITPGAPLREYSVEATCDGSGSNLRNTLGGCGAVLLVDASDMFKEQREGMSRQTIDTTVTYICPQCSLENILPEDKWPPAPSLLRNRPTEKELRDARAAIDPY